MCRGRPQPQVTPRGLNNVRGNLGLWSGTRALQALRNAAMLVGARHGVDGKRSRSLPVYTKGWMLNIAE